MRENGHTTSVLGIHGDALALYHGLTKRKPDLVFNLMETFGARELGLESLLPAAGTEAFQVAIDGHAR